MKKLFYLLAVSAFFMLSSCDGEETPRDVAKQAMESLKNMDMEKMILLSSKEAKTELENTLKMLEIMDSE